MQQPHKELTENNIRSHVDDREITPGNKYYDWELKGVPLRIEIGPRDIEKKEIVLVQRNSGGKRSVRQEGAVQTIKEELDLTASTLFTNAKKLLDENMHRVQTIDEAKERKGIIEIPWCGNEDCAMEVENILEGNTLGEPIDKEVCKHACPVCDMAAKTWMRFAKTY